MTIHATIHTKQQETHLKRAAKQSSDQGLDLLVVAAAYTEAAQSVKQTEEQGKQLESFQRSMNRLTTEIEEHE